MQTDSGSLIWRIVTTECVVLPDFTSDQIH